MNICTIVKGETIKEFLLNLDKMQEINDFIELRVDYVKDLDIEHVQLIRGRLKVKNIFTCRKSDEGGNFIGTEEVRIAIIEKALGLGFDHIDIELSTIDKISLDNKQETKLICSYHDFEKTPDYNILQGIIDDMKKTGADILKIVSMSGGDDDNRKLFKLLLNNQDMDIIVLGMGEAGKKTRLLAPLLGAYLTFASVGEAKSAPGQVELGEMRNIYKLLNI